MPKVGVDLDGTISKMGFYNPSVHLPQFLFFILLPFIYFFPPKKESLQKLREMESQGWQIIIVSARPPRSTAITRKWLERYGVPFEKIFCLGFGKGTKERKMDIIRKEGIEIFFDDDRKLVDFFRENFIEAGHL